MDIDSFFKLSPVRRHIFLFCLHFAGRVWTPLYFAPNIIESQKRAKADSFGTDLLRRAARWRTLKYVSVGLFIAVSPGFIPLCLKIMNLKMPS